MPFGYCGICYKINDLQLQTELGLKSSMPFGYCGICYKITLT